MVEHPPTDGRGRPSPVQHRRSNRFALSEVTPLSNGIVILTYTSA